MKKTILIISMIIFACSMMVIYNMEFNEIALPETVVSNDYEYVFLAINRGVYGTMIGNYSYGFLDNYGIQTKYVMPYTEEDNYTSEYIEYYYQLEQYRQGTIMTDEASENLYLSKVNLGGIFFSMLDTMLNNIDGLSQEFKLRFYHILSSAGFIALLLFIGCWCYREFGLLSSLLVFISLIGSMFLAPFGSGLSNSAFVYFLPFTCSLFVLNYEDKNDKKLKWAAEFFIIFTAVSMKAMMGYELLPTVMVSATVMYFYYAISRKWKVVYFIKRFASVSAAAISGFIFTLLVHYTQLTLLLGDRTESFGFLMESFGKRTWGKSGEYNASFSESLNAEFGDVVDKYLNYTITHGFLYKMTLQQFLTATIFVVMIALLLSYAIGKQNKTNNADVDIQWNVISALVTVVSIGAVGACAVLFVRLPHKRNSIAMVLAAIALVEFVVIILRNKIITANINIVCNRISIVSIILLLGFAGACSAMLLLFAMKLAHGYVYAVLALLIILAALAYILFKKQENNTDIENIISKIIALCTAIFIAVVGAFSTLYVMKAHSYIHYCFSSIVFYIPMSILVFALCGYLLRIMLIKSKVNFSKLS